MTVELTDEQFAFVYHALGEIAHGYYINRHGNMQRNSRTMCQEIARKAFSELGYNWQKYPTPERL